MKRFLRSALLFTLSCAACSSSTPTSEHEHHHAHGKGYHHRFEDAERWSKIFDAPDRDAWQRPDEVVALLAISPKMTVADLGAGTGYFLSRLSRAVGEEGRVLGLDVEPDMVEHMKSRAQKEGLANVEARVVAPDDPGLAKGSIDRLLIVDTWHHIDDRPRYVAKLKEALAPNGGIYIVDFTLEASHGPPKQHRIPPEGVIKELEAGGLRGEILEETLPDQYVVRGFVSAE